MRPRRYLTLSGDAAATAAKAEALISALDDDAVLWVGGGRGDDGISPRELRRRLGRSYDAVVLDLHRGLDPDLLAQAQGFVWGGGALIVRLPAAGQVPAPMQERLAVFPFTPHDVGDRLWRRALPIGEPADDLGAPLAPGDRPRGGSDEQAAIVDVIAERLCTDASTVTVLTADRGRGKSSALGLASRRAADHGSRRVVVTAPSEDAVSELLRFAGEAASFVSPEQLIASGAHTAADVIIVDEAAQLSVPLLRAIVQQGAEQQLAPHLVFATTVHGYEGTGRGFALRFVQWLRDRAPAPLELTLNTPIRWGPDDPLEEEVFKLLALDAEPAAIDDDRTGTGTGAPTGEQGSGQRARPPRGVEHVRLDKGELASDESLLRGVFGLLVQAHYRTTPADLHRLLDAPNLEVEVMLDGGAVVAATLLAKEGGLPRELSEALARGDQRIRGHALPDMIVAHGGRPRAGPLVMLRSVRIATHPARRRERLAARLVEHVHQGHRGVALFGTLFGATPELIAFRRSVGYELVRLGAARGSRTGEPAAVMVRPATDEARALVSALRDDLARDLPLQLALHAADPGGRVSEAMRRALLEGLPAPAPLDDERLLDEVRRTVHGPRPLEAAAWAMTTWLQQREADVRVLDGDEAAGADFVLERFLKQQSWAAIAERGDVSVPAAMRAARRALARLVPAER